MKKGTMNTLVLLLMVIVLGATVLISCSDGIAYTVVFDNQDGNSAESIKALKHSILTEPTLPPMESYESVGWYTDSYCTNASRWDFNSDTVKSDMTLYAKWEFTGLSENLGESSYSVGGIGPAGGNVFYDKGNYTDGWRYLEAAPATYETIKVWGGYGIPVGTDTAIGTGESNTEKIVSAFGYSEPYYFKTDYAAKVCADLVVIKGRVLYNDWFLPSKDELNLIFENLKGSNIGGFSDDWYLSSSEYSRNFSDERTKYACSHLFFNGMKAFCARYNEYRFRPVRAF